MTCLVFTLQEALQEQAKQKEELLKNFDTWKLEALSHRLERPVDRSQWTSPEKPETTPVGGPRREA